MRVVNITYRTPLTMDWRVAYSAGLAGGVSAGRTDSIARSGVKVAAYLRGEKVR